VRGKILPKLDHRGLPPPTHIFKRLTA